MCHFFLLFCYCQLRFKCIYACVCVPAGVNGQKRIQSSPSTGWLLWTWDASCIPGSSACEVLSSFSPSLRRRSWKRSHECTQRTSSYHFCGTFCISTIQILKTLLCILSLKTGKTHNVLKEHIKSADTQKARTPSVASVGNNYKEVAKMHFFLKSKKIKNIYFQLYLSSWMSIMCLISFDPVWKLP